MITVFLFKNLIEADDRKYASFNKHPDICKYLIDEGADLDSLEPDFLGGNLMM